MITSSDIEFYELANGIRLVHKYDDSPVAYCGFAIKVGTRDEMEEESGMAHFIEHTLFKGTERRKSWHILNCLESVGGELNAYTTKEETFVYANFLCEDFERAFDLCADIVFHATFPQKEIDKEVDVIIDEIHSYKDSPAELIYDDFESELFAGSSIGRNILGEAKRLKKYKTEDALRFVGRTYCTDKILFFSLGRIPFKKVVRWAQKFMGDVPARLSTPQVQSISAYEPFHKHIKKHTSQLHEMIGNRAYGLSDDKRLPLYLLNNILGGPSMNSRLNLILREKNGIAYTVESSYTSYTDTGYLSIYFGTDERNREKSTDLVVNELKRLCEQPFTTLQLDRYKKQLMGQLAISQENKENLVLSIAKSFLHFNRFESLEEVRGLLQSITPQTLLEVANEIVLPSRLSYLVYGKGH